MQFKSQHSAHFDITCQLIFKFLILPDQEPDRFFSQKQECQKRNNMAFSNNPRANKFLFKSNKEEIK